MICVSSKSEFHNFVITWLISFHFLYYFVFDRFEVPVRVHQCQAISDGETGSAQRLRLDNRQRKEVQEGQKGRDHDAKLSWNVSQWTVLLL